jgi:hypothetical protein
MAGTKLTPEKITSPIQLMAAWFAMLILLVSVFLTAAANIRTPDWAAGFLVIFSSLVTLIVIGCVTLMLTVFRPHLQEGKEYAQWLKDKNAYSPGLIDQEMTAPKRARRASRESSVASLLVDKNFHIDVNGRCPGSDKLVAKLRRAGFRAEKYEVRGEDQRIVEDLEEQAAIWVGARVEGAGAVQAIKLALDVWPHLKYMELSTDGSDPPDEVHDALFFGGATSTARERRTRPWSAEEIRALPDSLTTEQFHAAIRAKYS